FQTVSLLQVRPTAARRQLLRARVLFWNPPAGSGTVCEYLRSLSADGRVALRPRPRKLHGDGALSLRCRAVNHVQPRPSVAVAPFTLHPPPFTLHPSPFTLHPSSFTHHTSSIRPPAS